MGKRTSVDESTEVVGTRGGRGATALGTPAITSSGLYYQPASRVGRTSREAPLPPTPEPRASRNHALLEAGRRRQQSQQSTHQIEGTADTFDDDQLHEHHAALLDRHTSPAKDSVIELLTDKASKLGIALERERVARQEMEHRADRLQALLDGESNQRKDLDVRVEKQERQYEFVAREKQDLLWEVEALRESLRDLEERSTAWMQEESERRRLSEEALSQEHKVALEYLKSIYHDEDRPLIGNDGGDVAGVLVRELRALGDALRERDAELEARANKLNEKEAVVKADRERREAMQQQLAYVQERFETSRQKARQLSAQLDAEACENEMLRARARAMEEEKETNTRALHERKERAQLRKRGDTRDMMADSKGKDDRIKSLESTLMQERARLEGELQSARTEFTVAAKESRRKAARLQRRCLELEYKVATRSDAMPDDAHSRDIGGNGANLISSASSQSTGKRDTRGERSDTSSTGTPFPFSSSSKPSGAVTGLISASSMLPWRRGTASSGGDASASGTLSSRSKAGRASGTSLAEVKGSSQDTDLRNLGRRDNPARRAKTPTVMATPGGSRRFADRLPDPAHHNESAPAWMRGDLAADKISVD